MESITCTQCGYDPVYLSDVAFGNTFRCKRCNALFKEDKEFERKKREDFMKKNSLRFKGVGNVKVTENNDKNTITIEIKEE